MNQVTTVHWWFKLVLLKKQSLYSNPDSWYRIRSSVRFCLQTAVGLGQTSGSEEVLLHNVMDALQECVLLPSNLRSKQLRERSSWLLTSHKTMNRAMLYLLQ